MPLFNVYFCFIMFQDIQMLEQRKAPLRWHATETAGHIEPDVQVPIYKLLILQNVKIPNLPRN